VKYPTKIQKQIVSLQAAESSGYENDIDLSITSKPYVITIYDSSGNLLTNGGGLDSIRVGLDGGTYHLYIYTVDELNNVELYITY